MSEQKWGRERDWKSYNEAPVRRGELYLSIDALVNDPTELARINHGTDN